MQRCETLIQTIVISLLQCPWELVCMQPPPGRYDVATVPFILFILSLAGDETRYEASQPAQERKGVGRPVSLESVG